MDQIPDEYQRVATASTSFFKVPSILDSNYGSRSVSQCHLVVTANNILVEIIDDQVKRVKTLDLDNIQKILVYHEFNPLKRYIVFLTHKKEVYIFSYEDLQLLNQWQDIVSMAIKNNDMRPGEPLLELNTMMGKVITVEKESLIVKKESNSQAKVEAASAIVNRIKEKVWKSQNIQLERERKELFALKKIEQLKNSIRGESTLPPLENETPSSNVRHVNVCKGLDVTSVRHRLFYDKWIICISISNRFNGHFICDPHLILHCSLPSLEYEVKLMKVFHLVSRNSSSGVQIVPIEPPVLRPNKTAHLFAICSIPPLPKVFSCHGLITFHEKQTDSEEGTFHQVAFPPVHLDLSSRKDYCLTLSSEDSGTRVPFQLIALIAASVCHTILLTSLDCSVQTIFDNVSRSHQFSKIFNFYYINSVATDPLHYALFKMSAEENNKITVTLYARTQELAVMLAVTILELLPTKCFIEETTNSKDKQFLNGENVIAKVKETVQYIMNKFETHPSKRGDTTNYATGRSNLVTSRQDIMITSEEYCKWRKGLHNLGNEIEEISKKF